jgi:putative tryptophan/tyrosine transport system substrate-binding protein
MRATWGSTRPVPLSARQLRRQTRRALLTRLTQVGLLAAGLELGAACDRLPGQAPRVPRIGWVANQGPAGDARVNGHTQALVAGLGDYGYIPGQNLQMESRFPTDDTQNSEMISELLQSGVDVLVTGGTAATLAAKLATSTAPIVGIYVGDPLGSGLVQSIARPGGNVTALANGGSEIIGKWLELPRLIEPTLRGISLLYNPQNASHVAEWEQLSSLAAASGLAAVPAAVLTIADLDVAFETAVAKGADAFIWSGFLEVDGDTRVAALALSHHLVSMGTDSSYPVAGGLMSYGPAVLPIYRRAAYYVDRILKGAKPADLPVELPTTYELVVNQATAKALGVTIPDEVAQQVTSWI